MNRPNHLAELLKRELQWERAGLLSESGGVLNRCYIFGNGAQTVFIKVNDAPLLPMYKAEEEGLKALAETRAILVPAPLYCGVAEGMAVLVMEYVELHSHNAESQRLLGEQLAKLHLTPAPDRFGFDCDNTIGTTPQINAWSDDWVSFFLEKRIGCQLKLIEKKYGDRELLQEKERFFNRFPSLFEGLDIRPSLLHGDLWGGNTARNLKGEPVIYDPACYYGHHEAELSISMMFGGFSTPFFEAYHSLIPKQDGFEERQKGYQLYHYLNHYNLFGPSYRQSSLSLIRGV